MFSPSVLKVKLHHCGSGVTLLCDHPLVLQTVILHSEECVKTKNINIYVTTDPHVAHRTNKSPVSCVKAAGGDFGP